jgi:hypothetical protein
LPRCLQHYKQSAHHGGPCAGQQQQQQQPGQHAPLGLKQEPDELQLLAPEAAGQLQAPAAARKRLVRRLQPWEFADESSRFVDAVGNQYVVVEAEADEAQQGEGQQAVEGGAAAAGGRAAEVAGTPPGSPTAAAGSQRQA